MPVTYPLRKPDGQRLWPERTKACKRLNRAGKQACATGAAARLPPRGRFSFWGGPAMKKPAPGRLLLVSTDPSAYQPPTFSVPFIMAQWPGKEQKNA